MFELIMVVAMPFLVNLSTGLIKQVGVIANAGGWRVSVIRAVVAVLSLIGAILTAGLEGGQIDPGIIETAALTVFNAVVATYAYFKGAKLLRK